MIHFECDYTQGFAPKVLEELVKTNMEQCSGYGLDQLCERGRDAVKKACGSEEIDVHFLVGGTQTNAVVINSLLHGYQGVISCESGHINTHETGAVEFTGHKVLVLPQHDGKLDTAEVRHYMETYSNDPQKEHVVAPAMIYISQPNEFGVMYTREELEEFRSICDDFGLYLFMDGARLGYGLAADPSLTLKDYAKLCDVFYIGMTKCGAGFGEIVVFKNKAMQPWFRAYMKQEGAMLAKGRLLGVQAYALMEDNYYLQINQKAIDAAKQIRETLAACGIEEYVKNNTNQIFPILSKKQVEVLEKDFVITHWCDVDDPDMLATRIVTSWGTTQADVDALCAAIKATV